MQNILAVHILDVMSFLDISHDKMSGKQTLFPTLRLSFKLSFLIKLIVRDGSGDPGNPAIGQDCWGTSYVTPFLNLHSFFPHLISHMTLCTFGIIVVINLCFPVSTGILMVFVVPSFLSSQTPAGRGGWPPFLCLVLSEVSSC